MPLRLAAFLFTALACSTARAEALPWLDSFSALQEAGFESAQQVSFTELSATVASNTYSYMPEPSALIGGNTISHVGNGMTGVLSIVQNNAPGAVVQQSVTVTIGQL